MNIIKIWQIFKSSILLGHFWNHRLFFSEGWFLYRLMMKLQYILKVAWLPILLPLLRLFDIYICNCTTLVMDRVTYKIRSITITYLVTSMHNKNVLFCDFFWKILRTIKLFSKLRQIVWSWLLKNAVCTYLPYLSSLNSGIVSFNENI